MRINILYTELMVSHVESRYYVCEGYNNTRLFYIYGAACDATEKQLNLHFRGIEVIFHKCSSENRYNTFTYYIF